MKKRKLTLKDLKIFIIILAVIILTAALFSCKAFDQKTSEEKTENTAETTAAQGQQQQQSELSSTEINIWDSVNPKERIALMDSIEEFMSLNSTIKINSRHFRSDEELLDQFEAASLAGSGPEILLSRLEAAQKLAASSVIKPIENEIDYTTIIAGLNEISSFNGKKYVIPFRAMDFLMLFYNKDLVSKVPDDFASLIQYCKEVNKPKENIYGFLLNSKEPDWIIPFIGGYEDWIIDYDTNSITLNSEATVKTLEFLVKIFNEDKIQPFNIEYEEINNSFKNGNTHMIINGSWAIDEYREAKLNFGVAKIPVVWEGFKSPTPMIDGIGFMLNINYYGDKLEAAQKLIAYLMSEDVQASWNLSTQTFSVLKNAADSSQAKDNPILQAAMEQESICRGKPNEEIIRVIRDAIRINFENVIMGNITPQDAVLKMQEDAIKLKSGNLKVEEIKQNSST
ncbi:MAG: extracellular solute-binding protein [Actinobacteria bacterium]|nr:extracellular solute-binding protein [Actinomycetota bacterium]